MLKRFIMFPVPRVPVLMVPVLVGCLASFSFALATPAANLFGQNQSQGPKPMPRNNGSQDDDPANLPDEMRSRMAIERQEKDYQKLIDSATQLNAMSAEVAKGYKENPSLTTEQAKKLASIEKLARRILTESGGEEVSDKSAEEQNLATAEAIDKLVSTAGEVKKSLETQTRFVVSAKVIANSNDLIHLAQYIRRVQK